MKSQSIDFYRFQKPMQVLQIILNVLTFGLFQFLINRSAFRRIFLFKKANVNNFDHVEVKSKATLTNKFSKVSEQKIAINDREFTAKTFTFNKKRYFIDPDNCQEAFRIKFRLEKLTHHKIHGSHSQGIKDSDTFVLRSTFGPNKMDFKIPSFLQILKQEIFSFVYYFQIFSIIVWCIDDYVYFCILLVFMTGLSLFFIVRETHAQMKKVREKLLSGTTVKVHRSVNGQLITVETDSDDLYPGDLIQIERNSLIQADVVLLKGSCLVNEAMLSGESRLIQKTPINNDKERFRKIELGSILFAGSKCEETFESVVLGVVWRTGFETLNGKMIRSVLSPKLGKCQMELDLSRFLMLMCAMGFLGGIVYMIFYFADNQPGVTRVKMVMRCLELITTLVPAFLPLCLAQSNYYGMKRMENMKIVCSSHAQLNIAGSVRTVFFDKTGTITENELTLRNFTEFSSSGGLTVQRPSEYNQINDAFKMTVASCHTLCYLKRHGQESDRRRSVRTRNVPAHRSVYFQRQCQ